MNRWARRKQAALDRSKRKRKPPLLMQSLDDLLPPGATFAVDEQGNVKINVQAKPGTEDAVAADIARRLNIDPSALSAKRVSKADVQDVVEIFES